MSPLTIPRNRTPFPNPVTANKSHQVPTQRFPGLVSALSPSLDKPPAKADQQRDAPDAIIPRGFADMTPAGLPEGFFSEDNIQCSDLANFSFAEAYGGSQLVSAYKQSSNVGSEKQPNLPLDIADVYYPRIGEKVPM